MSKGILSVEIADDFIRYVFLRKTWNGYTVSKVGKSEQRLDLSTPGALTKEIKYFINKDDLAPQFILTSVILKDVVVRQVIVPTMKLNEIEEVVVGEVDRIPAMHNRLSANLHKRYTHTRDKDRLVLAAITRKALDALLREVKDTNISMPGIEIAPLNLKELPHLLKPSNKCEGVLVIHEHQAYLVVYKKRELRFIYKLSSGASQLNPNLPQEVAERVIKSWSSEIHRAIKSFLLENKDATLQSLWLVWDKAKLPTLDQDFAKHLSLTVKPLEWDKIKGIQVEEGVAKNPIYALAMTPVICHLKNIKPNFALDHFLKRFQSEKYFAKVLTGSLIFAGIVLAGGFGSYKAIAIDRNALVREKKSMDQTINSLMVHAQDLYRQNSEYIEIRKQILDQATYVQELNRISWSEVMSLVSKELPEDVALELFQYSGAGQVTIKGQSFEVEPVAEMIRRIADSETLSAGRFDFLKERKFEEIKYFDFGILASLQNNQLEEVNDEQQTKN